MAKKATLMEDKLEEVDKNLLMRQCFNRILTRLLRFMMRRKGGINRFYTLLNA